MPETKSGTPAIENGRNDVVARVPDATQLNHAVLERDWSGTGSRWVTARSR